MFEAKLSSPLVVVEPLRAAYELVKDDVAVEINKEGISLRAMDPANVAMVSLKISKNAFDTYELDKETVIGVNMERLVQVLKRAKRNTIMGIKVEEGKLAISYIGAGVRRFSIPLLALESGPRPEPNLNFTVKAVVNSDALKEAIEDARVVSDSMIFEAREKELRMIAQGDLGEVETVMRKDEGLEEIEVQEEAKAKYSLEYLKKMIKGGRISSIATLQFKTDYPMRLEFNDVDVNLAFILAPRIDVE